MCFESRPPWACLSLLVVLAAVNGAVALFPRPEAVTPGEKTLCLSRHLVWKAVGYTSDILEAGFDRCERAGWASECAGWGCLEAGSGGARLAPRCRPCIPPHPACRASCTHPLLADWSPLPPLPACQRYTDILKAMPLGLGQETHPAGPSAALAAAANGSAGAAQRHHKRRCHLVESVAVSVTSSDQSLNLETRESYSLEVAAGAAMIQANSVYGALRGMETLAQLARRRELRCSGTDGVDGDSGDGGGAEGGGAEGGEGEGGCTAEGRLVPPEAVWPGESGSARRGRACCAARVQRVRREC